MLNSSGTDKRSKSGSKSNSKPQSLQVANSIRIKKDKISKAKWSSGYGNLTGKHDTDILQYCPSRLKHVNIHFHAISRNLTVFDERGTLDVDEWFGAGLLSALQVGDDKACRL